MFRKRKNEKKRRMRMSARTLRTDIFPTFMELSYSISSETLKNSAKVGLRYDMGGYMTKKMHNSERSRYLIMDFCANLYNTIVNKLKGKILNALFTSNIVNPYDSVFPVESLFARGTFLTDAERIAFLSDNTFPFKYNSHYEILIDHIFGIYSKGGTNPNYHLAKYNVENQVPKTFEDERKEIGPLTDYDFSVVVNPYLPPATRDVIINIVRGFFDDNANILSIIKDNLTYHPFGKNDIDFTVEELVKETLLVEGEELDNYDYAFIKKRSDSDIIKYETVFRDLRRIFLEPFDIDERLKARFNPIAEFFDFDCHFDYSDEPFEQPNLGCHNLLELNVKYWDHWIEIRKTPVNSYSEYLLKEKPVNDFVNIYLQTLDIAIEDINNVVERTKMVQDVKLAKRLRRKQVLETIVEKRERRKKILETLQRNVQQPASVGNEKEEDEEMMACEVQPVDTAEHVFVREISREIVNAINARTLRTTEGLNPDASFTFNYKGDSKYVQGAPETIYFNFERLFDTGARLYKEFGPSNDVRWVYTMGTLRVEFEGYVVQPDQSVVGQFQMQLILNQSSSGKWLITSGEITIV